MITEFMKSNTTKDFVLITNVDAAKSINAVESGSVTAGKDVVVNFEV